MKKNEKNTMVFVLLFYVWAMLGFKAREGWLLGYTEGYEVVDGGLQGKSFSFVVGSSSGAVPR